MKKGHGRQVYFKDSDLWVKLEEAAEKENRSVNNFIETTMKERVKVAQETQKVKA